MAWSDAARAAAAEVRWRNAGNATLAERKDWARQNRLSLALSKLKPMKRVNIMHRGQMISVIDGREGRAPSKAPSKTYLHKAYGVPGYRSAAQLNRYDRMPAAHRAAYAKVTQFQNKRK